MIPDKCPTIVSGDFSTKVTLQNQLLRSVSLPYHIFQLDEVEGKLLSDEPASNLFLSHLFALQRNYPKALFYLQRAQDYTYDLSGSLIDAFLLLKDESPEALAFSLRFCLFIKENRQQYLQNVTELGSIPDLNDDYYPWMGKVYEQYLRTLSSKQVSRIPEYIALSYQEEGQILKSLHQLKCSDSPQEWRKIFTIREELLKKKTTSHTTPPMQYPTSLPAYQCLPNVDAEKLLLNLSPCFEKPSKPLKPYVRITKKELGTHFISLYEKAQNQEADLDILYLLRSGEDDLLYAYAGLLHYVNRYPTLFANLCFGVEPKENKKTFKQIVSIYVSWKSQLREKSSSITARFTQMTPFFYRASVPLALPSPPSLDPYPSLEFKKNHFLDNQRALYRLFISEYLASGQPCENDALFPVVLSPQTRTEKELLQELEQGHARQPRLPTYQLREKITLEGCLEKTQSLLVEKRDALKSLKEDAEQKANAYPDLDFRIGMRKLARNLPHLTMEGILTKAYETQDPHLIRKANPALSPKEVHDLYEMTILFHLSRIEITQLERGIEALKRRDIQQFGQLLTPLDGFDPIEEPEVFLFCSRTQKLLREEQKKLLQWDFTTKAKTKLFAAKAGEGKTTLYQPIAMKRSHRKKQFPISLSPGPLYQVDREGLRASTQQVFDFPLGVAEITLDQPTTASHHRKFCVEMTWIADDKGLKMTPEHYYALDLKYQLALESEDVESVRWLSTSLQLFASKGNGYVDECRINLSPFSQAKIGMGKPKSLPKRDVRLFIEIYQALLAADGKGAIEHNLQATLVHKQLEKLKEKALSLLVQGKFMNFPKEKQKQVLAYWKGEGPRPDWIKVDSKQGWNVEGVRIYFDEFYSSAMALIGKMRHLPSTKPGEEIHVPAKKGKATTSYFEEIYLTVIATIQGTLQNGLTLSQVKRLLKHLHEKNQGERSRTGSLTSSEELLQKWTEDPTLRLHTLPLSNGKVVIDLQAKIGKNQEVIFWYLQHLVEYSYTSEQLSVTPFHFLHAMNQSTLFSADPGPAEIYGIYDNKAVRKDTPFLAQVVVELEKQQNQHLLSYSPPSSPLEFFSSLSVDLFDDLTMMIDSGGTLLDFSPKKIAKGFFSFIEQNKLPFDGIIFFQGEELHVWLSDWGKSKILKGNEVKEALASHGLQWEKLRLFTYIDPSHTYGANIAQPADARGLLLVGEETSFGDVAQGALRLREFLSGEQKITWGIPEPLAKKIGDTPLSPGNLLSWTMQNEAARIEKEVLLSALQQIQFHVESRARQELKSAQDNPQRQIQIWKKYRKGFVTPFDPDLVLRFGKQATPQETRALLLAFAKEKYNLFGYSTPWEKAEELHKLLLLPIEAACRRTPKILSRATRDTHQEVHIHSFQQQEMHQIQEQEQEGVVDLSPVSPNPLLDRLFVDSPILLSTLQKGSRPADQIFHTKHMTPTLYFTENALRTATLKGQEMREKYLKPVSYILLIEQNSKLFAFALSHTEAAFFQNQLVKKTKGSQKVALLNVDGTLTQNGKGKLAFSKTTLSSSFVKRVSMEVGLTRCELFHPELFLERLDTWDDFWPMWTQIKQAQPSLKQGRPGLIERLIPPKLKQAPPKKQEKKRGFFASFFN
ncbi:MAG: hypothetical protein K940chlam9_01537 [Chlamydiae bacterium]|nr:hypothetical protein [Chlamydiota bacterium]